MASQASPYQVIARKWRPQSFQELIGQDHVAQTLINGLRAGRMAHAFLFAGPRGTGKTSTARILAKSLRCQKSNDFIPCGECFDCQDIAVGRSLDVLEIDGASNNGVDSIRELRDAVSFRPSTGIYRIYIIDEVHMLSTSAFNALLKTLEEPPAHVVFILATTEIHKIPATILSRCQRYDFRKIRTRLVVDHLKKICESDSIAFEDEALWAIARLGEGSMRDSQSILDQVITYAQSAKVSLAQVLEISGSVDQSIQHGLIEGLSRRDPRSVGQVLLQLSDQPRDPSLLLQNLMEMLRNSILLQENGLEDLLDLSESESQFLKNLGNLCPIEELHLIFDMALKLSKDLIRVPDPMLVLQVGLMRMVHAPRVRDITNLDQHRPTLPEVESKNLKQSKPAAILKPLKDEVHIPSLATPTTASGKWVQFVDKVRSQDAIFGAKLESLLLEGESDKKIQLKIPERFAFLKSQIMNADVQAKLNSYLNQFWSPGVVAQIGIGNTNDAKLPSVETIKKEKLDQEEVQLRKLAEDHPLVKSAASILNGKVKSIE